MSDFSRFACTDGKLLQEVVAHKLNHRVEEEVSVPLLPEAVTFILSEHVPNRSSLFLERRNDLFGL